MPPWGKLHSAVVPFYPKVEGAGRPLRMLRVYVAQQCFGLSDKDIEDAIYDSQAIRAFVGIDLGHESAPDATTLLKSKEKQAEVACRPAISRANLASKPN